MRNALGFVLDFTAIFVAMGALAGTTLGAIAFALLFGGAAPFYQCMDPSPPWTRHDIIRPRKRDGGFRR